MKYTKLLIYSIITFITSLNILYLYFGEGLMAFSASSDYFTKVITPLIIISILFLENLLVTSSYISTKAISKKNLLKIPLLITSILFIASIIKRIMEILNGYYCIACWLNTGLYLLLIITNIMILKDLYHLIQNLFEEKKI